MVIYCSVNKSKTEGTMIYLLYFDIIHNLCNVFIFWNANSRIQEYNPNLDLKFPYHISDCWLDANKWQALEQLVSCRSKNVYIYLCFLILTWKRIMSKGSDPQKCLGVFQIYISVQTLNRRWALPVCICICPGAIFSNWKVIQEPFWAKHLILVQFCLRESPRFDPGWLKSAQV